MSPSQISNQVEFVKFAQVVVDNSVEKALDYGIPSELISSLKVGMRVEIKVRNALKKGTVVSISYKSSFPKVSPILNILSETLFSDDLLSLAEWMAKYYCASLKRVLQLFLPSPIREDKKAKQQLLVSSLLSQEKLAAICLEKRMKNPQQAAVLECLLQEPKGILLTKLLEKAKVSISPVNTLIKQNLLVSNPVTLDRNLSNEEYFPSSKKTLSEEQNGAFIKIVNTLESSQFKTHLLHGVTGSGKTEVYLQAISHARSLGKSALMLVPEIALTTQMIERFRSRFQEKIGIYHHRLCDGERRDLWHQIAQGEVKIVLGARSAVFLPLKDLKLIIVDEEHEPSYKQSELSPCYHGRDVAIMRGFLSHATVVLGSATPSLESYQNALSGKYILSTLSSRATKASLPKIELVNMQLEMQKSEKFSLFAPKLLDAIAKRVSLGEQSLLFLNRRGYNSLLMCSKCQDVKKCPHCDISLTYHFSSKSLHCHYCDYALFPAPKTCNVCKDGSPLLYKGYGTEQVELSLKRIFPQIRTLRMDADTTRHKGSHQQLFKEFRSGKADVLIGTQMIAKGFHFPSVTLVGVLNVDQMLYSGDFRASEHLFQLIVQVAGRSGRGELPGEVLIQTFMPHHQLFSYIKEQNYKAFYEGEIASRELFGYPPFTHLAKILFTGEDENKVRFQAEDYQKHLVSLLPPLFSILPVIPDRVSKIKGLYRFFFLVKGPSMGLFSTILKKVLTSYPLKSGVKLLIDIDS